jgi:uncharacterized membrane protein
MSDAPIVEPKNDTEPRVMALIAYGLFVAALFNGVTAIVGVVLAYVMRGNYRGTIWEGHFRNLIHVFWITAVVLAVTIAIAVEGFGGMFYALLTNRDPGPALAGLLFLLAPLLAIIGLVFLVWFLYRTVRGVIHALEDKAY